MGWVGGFFDWLDSRTGIRTARKHLLDEPLPAGVGWWFVTGNILLMLLAVQLISGVVLTFYYVPSPEFAYDSVRYIMERVTFGRVLLPWDQKAYWATTVTINIAKSGPFGEYVAGLMQGGTTLGSLTLLRWYAAHVFLLPGALIMFVVAHLYLMRRHGISGALKPVEGPSRPFYPDHALKDTIASALVFALLLGFAVVFRPPLDAIADPTDANYIPRPEWYFLSLFQLLKYFPGPLEPLATMVIPGLIVGLLFMLPFLDSHADRHPMKRPLVTGGFAVIGAAIIMLTYLGYQDTPAHADPLRWTPLAIAGREFARDDRCVKCHRPGGVGSPIAETRVRHDPSG